ncbi:MAG: hypothetical protein JSU66_00890 [Deltaproteobacteria bacterium]|nr:MAG: hypothetical protein JSU66_00890 [Deltaproteobacteria bacterium]
MRRLAVGCAAFAALCAYFWLGAEWISPLTDDAFISYRYAENLVDGHGVVFNPGERVEGYTNFLWVLLLALGYAAGFDLPGFSRGLSVLCAAGLVVALARFSIRYFRDEPVAGISYLAPALLTASLVFIRHIGIGLESMLFALLVFLAVAVHLERERASRSGFPVGLLFGLAYLTRPDAVVWLAALALSDLAWAVLQRTDLRREIRRVLEYGSVFAVIVAAHVGWRLHYYGDLVPNTYYMRAAGNWLWGLKSVTFFFVYSTGFLAVLAVLAGPPLLRRRWALCLGVLVAAYAGFVLRNGGAGGRYAIPLAPFVFLLIQELVRRPLASAQRAGITPPWRARPAALWIAVVSAMYVGGNVYEWRVAQKNAWFSNYANRNATLFGRCIREATDPDDWVASVTAGVLPYYARRPVIDMLGLNDRHIARKGKFDPQSLPGHQRSDSDYVLDRRPRIIFMNDERSRVGSVHAIDEMLENPRLHDLYELTPFRCGRFDLEIFVSRAQPIDADRILIPGETTRTRGD